MEEGKEDKIKQFGAGENAADPLKSAEVPLEFIALHVKRTHALSRSMFVRLGRNCRDHTLVKQKLPGFTSLIGTVHSPEVALRTCDEFVRAGHDRLATIPSLRIKA